MSYSTEYSTTHPTRDEIDAMREPLVVEFGIDSCPHCRAAAAVAKPAFQDYPGIRHIKVEDGRGRLLGRSFGVKLWPTFVFMQEGEEVERLVRPTAEQPIRDALDRIDTR